MKSRQINFIAMCRRVSELLCRFPEIVHELPYYNELKESFENNELQLENLATQQQTVIKGLKLQKEELKSDLNRKTMEMSYRIEAYAKIKGDVVLQRMAHRAETLLFNLPDNDFMSSCNIIYGIANENREKMSEFGVNDSSLLIHKTAIDSFRYQVDAPKMANTERKQFSDQIELGIVDQRGVLNKLDALMELTHFTHPAFYAEYQDTRKVLYRSRTLAVQCRVTDAATGKGLEAVEVSFYRNGELVLQKNTYKAGGAKIKSLDEGSYTVTVSRLGYITQTLTVNKIANELTRIEVELVRE